jgi:hypothetical protein
VLPLEPLGPPVDVVVGSLLELLLGGVLVEPKLPELEPLLKPP